MVKKCSKLLILTALLLCILMVPSLAKEVTKENIGVEIDKINSDTDTIWIIGEYVFTTNHTITTQDVMLAARSIHIQNPENALEEMAIYELSREYDEDYEPTGKWIVEDNSIGKQLDKENFNLNISYVDNESIPEDTKIKVSLDNVDELLEKSKETLKYEKNSENLKLSEKGELTGLIELNEEVDTSVFPQNELTGYYFAYTLQVEGTITDATTVKLTNGSGDTKVLTGKSAFDNVEDGLMLILAHLDKNEENKTLKIEVDLDGESKEYTSAKYIIDWSNVDFQSDSERTKVIVNTEKELKEALAKETVTEIFVAQNIELGDVNDDEKHSHTLIIDIANRKVTIKSLDSKNPVTISDKEQTEEGEKDKTPVIEVKSGDVTFENIKIEGATRAISVKSGATVIANNVVAIDSQDTAFDVEEGATFTGTGLQYLKTTADGNTVNKESYHYPTICGKGTVTVTDKEPKKVEDYKRIVSPKEGKYEDIDFRDPETHQYYPEFQDPNDSSKLKEEYQKLLGTPSNIAWDELRNTQHTHYYLDAENAEYYMVYLRDGAITKKYFAKGDEIKNTSENYNSTGYYKNVLIVNDKSYVRDGWSKQSYYTLLANAQKEYKWNTAKITDPVAAKDCTLYPRYVEGYSIIIETDETKTDGTKITKRFGVKQNEEKTIQNLIDEIPEFKKVYEALEEKAQNGSVIIDINNSDSEVNRETKISRDMKLEVKKVQQTSYAQFLGPNTNELKTNGNSISGIINTKSENGKYYLPITIASENFQNEVSTITVTDPNNNTEVYTYSENAENEIATVSNVKAMNLQLEAIKESNIASGNKIYKIAIDMDGENENEYAVLNYIIDYNKVKTIEEMINKAAENTQKANNLTLQRNNDIKGNKQNCTVEYDRETGRRYYTEGEVTQYTFAEREVNENAANSKICVQKVSTQTEEEKAYLNNWEYCNSFSKVGDGVLELELLKDIVSTNGTIRAVLEVSKTDEQENTYVVVVSHEKISDWLNRNYIDFATNETKEGENTYKFEDVIGVVLKVTLDSNNEYVTSIKTLNNFTITKDGEVKQTYKNNKIDVTITKIGTTDIKTPQQMLGENDEHPAINTEIQEFIKKGRQWWDKHIHS